MATFRLLLTAFLPFLASIVIALPVAEEARIPRSAIDAAGDASPLARPSLYSPPASATRAEDESASSEPSLEISISSAPHALGLSSMDTENKAELKRDKNWRVTSNVDDKETRALTESSPDSRASEASSAEKRDTWHKDLSPAKDSNESQTYHDEYGLTQADYDQFVHNNLDAGYPSWTSQQWENFYNRWLDFQASGGQVGRGNRKRGDWWRYEHDRYDDQFGISPQKLRILREWLKRNVHPEKQPPQSGHQKRDDMYKDGEGVDHYDDYLLGALHCDTDDCLDEGHHESGLKQTRNSKDQYDSEPEELEDHSGLLKAREEGKLPSFHPRTRARDLTNFPPWTPADNPGPPRSRPKAAVKKEKRGNRNPSRDLENFPAWGPPDNPGPPMIGGQTPSSKKMKREDVSLGSQALLSKGHHPDDGSHPDSPVTQGSIDRPIGADPGHGEMSNEQEGQRSSQGLPFDQPAEKEKATEPAKPEHGDEKVKRQWQWVTEEGDKQAKRQFQSVATDDYEKRKRQFQLGQFQWLSGGEKTETKPLPSGTVEGGTHVRRQFQVIATEGDKKAKRQFQFTTSQDYKKAKRQFQVIATDDYKKAKRQSQVIATDDYKKAKRQFQLISGEKTATKPLPSGTVGGGNKMKRQFQWTSGVVGGTSERPPPPGTADGYKKAKRQFQFISQIGTQAAEKPVPSGTGGGNKKIGRELQSTQEEGDEKAKRHCGRSDLPEGYGSKETDLCG